jgi:hypothetical protein
MRHSFNFDGGEYLTTMGACWFVCYKYYIDRDHKFKKWETKNLSSRISTFNRTKQLHIFFLQQILKMKIKNLNKNHLGVTGDQIIGMTKILLS